MKNYSCLIAFSLSFYFLAFNISNVQAQKNGNDINVIGVSAFGYGKQIVITDHVPDGGNNTLSATTGVDSCICTQQLAYNNTTITTPNKIFIPWTDFEAVVHTKYRILIQGKSLIAGYPTFASDIYIHYGPNSVGLMNTCGNLGPNLITNESLTFDYWPYPKYTVSFYQNGVLIEFFNGVINAAKIYQLTNCTAIEINTRKQKITETSLKINPNPFQNSVIVDYSIGQTTNASLNIYNATGQKLITVFENKVIESGQYQEKLQLDLAKGIYFAILQTSTQRKLIKIVKQY